MPRLGVIGYGRRMRHLVKTLARFRAGTQIVGVVDPRADDLRRLYPDELEGVTFYHDVTAMLDDAAPDGVMVGTRCSLHTPLAIEVLERDLPLFLEKPVAADHEQLAALRHAAARSQSQVVVSSPLHLSAICQTAPEVIDSGTVGTVEHVQAVNNVPFYSSDYYHNWMRDGGETGGRRLQKATRDFDYLNALIRQRPVRVAAMESKTVFQGDMPAGLRCVDCYRQVECAESPSTSSCRASPRRWSRTSGGAASRSTPAITTLPALSSATNRGCTPSIRRTSTRCAARRRAGTPLIGYRGTLSFDRYGGAIVVDHQHSPRVERPTFTDTGHGHHGGDEELLRDSLASLTGHGESCAPLTAGLQSAGLCLLAREACQTGRVMAVPTRGEALAIRSPTWSYS